VNLSKPIFKIGSFVFCIPYETSAKEIIGSICGSQKSYWYYAAYRRLGNTAAEKLGRVV
jgi:hypothetical protein